MAVESLTIESIKLDASDIVILALSLEWPAFKWVQNSQPPRVAEVGRLSPRAKMHFQILDEKGVFVCICKVATINYYNLGKMKLKDIQSWTIRKLSFIPEMPLNEM